MQESTKISIYIKDYMLDKLNSIKFSGFIVDSYKKTIPCIQNILKSNDRYTLYSKDCEDFYEIILEINDKKVLEIIFHKNKITMPDYNLFYLSLDQVPDVVTSRIIYFTRGFYTDEKHWSYCSGYLCLY